jgi:hypothetical protein
VDAFKNYPGQDYQVIGKQIRTPKNSKIKGFDHFLLKTGNIAGISG